MFFFLGSNEVWLSDYSNKSARKLTADDGWWLEGNVFFFVLSRFTQILLLDY